jgi:predicted phosphodiesterase
MNSRRLSSRRAFLKTLSFSTAPILLPLSVRGASIPDRPLRFGLIADVHQDVMHDGSRRIGLFVDSMNQVRPDFICQLGDFCVPHDRNRPFLHRWEKFDGPRYHVLGNHDMDGGYDRSATVSFYKMPGRHYSINVKGVHVVVLDGNDPGGAATGYHRFMAAGQVRWLADDLEATDLPTILFIHQALDHPEGIENQAEIRALLERVNRDAGTPRVLACFSGHHHQDYVRSINGIHYVQINSASYYWLPAEFARRSYPDAVHDQYRWIERTAPYRDPLWALVTLDLGEGVLRVEGRTTEWVGASPWERGADRERFDPETIRPVVSDRHISI